MSRAANLFSKSYAFRTRVTLSMQKKNRSAYVEVDNAIEEGVCIIMTDRRTQCSFSYLVIAVGTLRAVYVQSKICSTK